jgi:AcrR family transcriptional regulator
MALRDEIREDTIRAALALAEHRPWGALTLAEIAEAAGLGLDVFHGTSGKAAIADAVEPWLDRAMSEEAVGLDPEGSPRERLFDVIMLRFEAMEPWRGGLISLMNWRERAPDRIAHLLSARRRSAHWALVSAGLDGSASVPLALKSANVAWAMARAERAWRKDTDPGHARTMAALDKQLRSAEERMGWLKRMTGKAGKDAKPEQAPAERPDGEDSGSAATP